MYYICMALQSAWIGKACSHIFTSAWGLALLVSTNWAMREPYMVERATGLLHVFRIVCFYIKILETKATRSKWPKEMKINYD